MHSFTGATGKRGRLQPLVSLKVTERYLHLRRARSLVHVTVIEVASRHQSAMLVDAGLLKIKELVINLVGLS